MHGNRHHVALLLQSEAADKQGFSAGALADVAQHSAAQHTTAANDQYPAGLEVLHGGCTHAQHNEIALAHRRTTS